MVGLPYDCLANPLGAVRLTFDKAVASASVDPAAFGGKDWGAVDLFREFLVDNGGLSQVPMLNASTIKWVQPNTLVRFRGMIQDMLGNEIYVGAYKEGDTWKTNKFADASECPIAPSADTWIWERRLLYCVPVPGQNPWTESCPEAVKNPCTKSSSHQREKRQREDTVMTTDIDMLDSVHEVEGFTSAKKMREDGMVIQPVEPQNTPDEGASLSANLELDCGRNSLPCLVKVYDCPESELMLNDVFEFIGIFTSDSDISEDNGISDELEQGFFDETLLQMPPKKVPRLHCIIHKKLAATDFLPSCPTVELKPHVVKELREALLGHFTTVLGNDRVAAQYMLLHLLSRVHARVDTIAVGKLSLNLTCFNKETASVFGDRLKHAIQNLLPFSCCMPLTIDYLNTVSLAPKKDYNTNRLASGFLQLPEGSHLTIDETPLQAGTLDSTGVANTKVLKTLMEFQKVEYDFTYYKMDMAADIQLLIISEAKSNILPADLVLPFRPSSIDCPSEVNVEMLQAWIWYLATMKSYPHSIEPDMQKVVEEDLVAARQADQTLGTSELSRLLTMARLMSASFGEAKLSMEHWQMVKELERQRRERLQGTM